MDIVGPFPRSSRGNKYLITMIDHFTRYAEAKPLKEATAAETAKAMLDLVVVRHGIPERLLTDQGKNFTSDLIRNLCRLLGTKKIQTTAYHPEGNGMVERLHRTIAGSMAHFVRKDGRDWDRWVPFALMAYRSIPHSSTGYSPNFMIFGREVRTPAEYQAEPVVRSSTEEYFPVVLRERLDEAYEEAVHRMERARAKRMAFCNKRRKQRAFKEGDLVYLHVPAIKPGHCRKFHMPWTGPHVISKRLSRVNYIILTADGRQIVVHINRLKLAKGQEPTERSEKESEGSSEDEAPEGTEDEEGEVSPGVWRPQTPDIEETECEGQGEDEEGEVSPGVWRPQTPDSEEIECDGQRVSGGTLEGVPRIPPSNLTGNVDGGTPVGPIGLTEHPGESPPDPGESPPAPGESPPAPDQQDQARTPVKGDVCPLRRSPYALRSRQLRTHPYRDVSPLRRSPYLLRSRRPRDSQGE